MAPMYPVALGIDLPMFRSLGFQLTSIDCSSTFLQKFTNEKLKSFTNFNKATPSRSDHNPSGSGGSSKLGTDLKSQLKRLQVFMNDICFFCKNMFSIHIFPYDFFVFCFVAFDVFLVVFPLQETRKKSSAESSFFWRNKLFQIRLHVSTQPSRSKNQPHPQPPPLAFWVMPENGQRSIGGSGIFFGIVVL